MVVLYTPVFAIGGFSHLVELYPIYTKEKGLQGEATAFRNRRKDVLINHINNSLTKPQKTKLSELMKSRNGRIVDEEGNVYNN